MGVRSRIGGTWCEVGDNFYISCTLANGRARGPAGTQRRPRGDPEETERGPGGDREGTRRGPRDETEGTQGDRADPRCSGTHGGRPAVCRVQSSIVDVQVPIPSCLGMVFA